MRLPKREDHERHREPSEGLDGEVGFLRACVVHDVVEAAQTRYARSYNGRDVLVGGNVDAHSIGGSGAFTHGTKVKTRSCAIEEVGNAECKDQGEEGHDSAVL